MITSKYLSGYIVSANIVKTWLVMCPAYINNNAHSNKLENQTPKYFYLSLIGNGGVREIQLLINRVYCTREYNKTNYNNDI